MARITRDREGNETDPLISKSLSDLATSHSQSSTHLHPVDTRTLPYTQNEDRSGGFVVILYILTTEMCERLAYYSIMAGLVLYCTSNLDIDQATATTLNQVFSGFVYLVPVIGGFLADSYLGRYRSIYISCIFYIAGVVLVPASAVNFSTWGWTAADTNERRAMFFAGLVLVGLGTGGIKANVGPFGAEQVEIRGKEAVQSFFNWFYWVINIGALIAFTIVAYVQQEISFAWGFFIPTLSMMLAALVFILGRAKYKKTAPKVLYYRINPPVTTSKKIWLGKSNLQRIQNNNNTDNSNKKDSNNNNKNNTNNSNKKDSNNNNNINHSNKKDSNNNTDSSNKKDSNSNNNINNSN
ncbi:solute carrier family 15 member 4-like [Elysia marginata]|uniref:Solute carrier family 15 member 4-like n=1 Tax=Elysia marginata TaxID=1093978 RepID=A0AAV4EID7_9GAST|nr:solute carrier family 15 member 4-like [Elysia marginata]